MTETKHTQPTPGLWKVDEDWTFGAPEVISKLRRIARVLYHGGSEDIEVHANARLIAAAPEMLAALIHVAEIYEGDYDYHQDSETRQMLTAVRGAIAQAKGETDG